MPETSFHPKECVSCHAHLHGPFCAQCGEAVRRADDLSMRVFLARAVGEITQLDSKLYRSFRRLLTRPGWLSQEYLAGRRRPYLKPIQMFLLANLVYFLVQPFSGASGYNTGLTSQIHQQFYSEAARLADIVDQEVQRRAMAFEDFARLFDARSATYAKTLVFLMVPLLAAATSLVYRRRRTYFAEHLIFAVHFYAWNLLFIGSILVPAYSLLLLALLELPQWLGFDFGRWLREAGSLVRWMLWMLTEGYSMFVAGAYFYFAARRFFGVGKAEAGIKSVLLVLLLFAIVLIYRYLLFWITFLTI